MRGHSFIYREPASKLLRGFVCPLRLPSSSLLIKATTNTSAGVALLWPTVECAGCVLFSRVACGALRANTMLVVFVPLFVVFLGGGGEIPLKSTAKKKSASLSRQNPGVWGVRIRRRSFNLCWGSFASPQAHWTVFFLLVRAGNLWNEPGIPA